MPLSRLVSASRPHSSYCTSVNRRLCALLLLGAFVLRCGAVEELPEETIDFVALDASLEPAPRALATGMQQSRSLTNLPRERKPDGREEASGGEESPDGTSLAAPSVGTSFVSKSQRSESESRMGARVQGAQSGARPNPNKRLPSTESVDGARRPRRFTGAWDETIARANATGTPLLGATRVATTVYKLPHKISKKLGYLRLGGVVERRAEPMRGSGCKGNWYEVKPRGFVCTEDATIDMHDPLIEATRLRPALDRPLPYAYGFVRATAPQYLRVPTLTEQRKSEFGLDDHLKWYSENYNDVQRVALGANDVALDNFGIARLGQRGAGRLSTQLSTTELLGGASPKGVVPLWAIGERKIPNVSGFEVPDYALFASRVRRKTGLSFVDAFVTESEGQQRRFAVTVDMRLVPATKVKPDTGSGYHGIPLEGLSLPLAIVSKRDVHLWRLIKGKDEARRDPQAVPHRAVLPLTGKARFKDGRRHYQLLRAKTRWLRAGDVGVIAPPPQMPPEAARGEKWIDVSLVQQVLVLYEGSKPVYATLVSTGKDRLGDHKKSNATPQGTFRLRSKHIAAAMDSEENSSVAGGTKKARTLGLGPAARATVKRLLAAEKAGTKLSNDDKRRLKNVKRGRHPEYGVTMRRGAGGYELRDVPWIQYFEAGYALHGAYWHDVFGTPRSHGCINLAPIDARYVFLWTDPPVPQGWHGLNIREETGRGTLVSVRK